MKCIENLYVSEFVEVKKIGRKGESFELEIRFRNQSKIHPGNTVL